MIFWRVVDNKLYPIKETDKLGFSTNDPSYIPDEYLKNREFVVVRHIWYRGDTFLTSFVFFTKI